MRGPRRRSRRPRRSGSSCSTRTGATSPTRSGARSRSIATASPRSSGRSASGSRPSSATRGRAADSLGGAGPQLRGEPDRLQPLAHAPALADARLLVVAVALDGLGHALVVADLSQAAERLLERLALLGLNSDHGTPGRKTAASWAS